MVAAVDRWQPRALTRVGEPASEQVVARWSTGAVSRRGWLLFLTLSAVWGIPYLFIRVAVADLSPAFVVFGRTALAAAVLLPLALHRGALRPLRPVWRWVVAFAVIEIALPFLALGYAEVRLTSSLTALLIAAVPLVALGFGRLAGLDLGAGDVPAVLAASVAVVGYAAGPLIAATRLAGMPGLGLSAAAVGLNAVGYAPVAWLTRPRQPVPVQAWTAVAVLGLVCSALAFVVFFALVAEVGPARTTVITYVNPAVAVAAGVAVLGEPLTVGILIGFPLIVAGSVLATSRSREPVAAPS